MSNALALAGVTAVLKDLLDNGLIDQSITSAVGGPVTVSTLAPDRIETGENEAARLNLFLYQVQPNAALRNVELPSRNGHGRRLTNPPLALDLQYLLTAYGAQDFEAEILLGYAMQLLHETPVLGREAIRTSLAQPSPVGDGLLPPAVGALAASDLADQVEQVKVLLNPLGTDELTRLWGAFQARYRPSAAYLVSVVLIEGQAPVRSPLPVLSRGEVDPVSGRERGVQAFTGVTAPGPFFSSVLPPGRQPAVRMGELLTLEGRELEGDTVAVRFVHLRSGEVLELPAEPDSTPARVGVRLPPDPAPGPVPDDDPLNPDLWQAGIHGVAVVMRRGGEEDRVAGVLPVVLAPRVEGVTVDAGSGGEVTVTVETSPPVRQGQRIRLAVGALQLPPDPFSGDETRSLAFTSQEFPTGSQWLRLLVDEAESLLVDRSASPPAFDPSQQVAIP